MADVPNFNNQFTCDVSDGGQHMPFDGKGTQEKGSSWCKHFNEATGGQGTSAASELNSGGTGPPVAHDALLLPWGGSEEAKRLPLTQC